MLGVVVDDRGRLWPAPSRELAGHLGSAGGGNDAEAEAIWSRGFVYLARLSDDLIVAFRPRLISRPTLAAAFFAICREAPHRVVLSTADSPLAPEIHVSLDHALQRMEELVSEAQREAPRGLSVKRMPFGAAETLAGGRLSGVLRAWSESRNRWTSDLYNLLQDQGLLDLAVVVHNPARSEALLIEHWGKRRDMFGTKWVREAPGKHLEDQPYSGLAHWAARLFRASIVAREPRLDAIAVAIQTRGGKIHSRRYARLLLPWRGPDGDAFGLTINIFDPLE
jgi:hypothetical protein